MTQPDTDRIESCDAARQFPSNTCGASRHAQLIGEQMMRGEWVDSDQDLKHCGESILAATEALWRLRTKTSAQLPAEPASDVLVSRLTNARAMAAERLPAQDVQAIDDAITALAAQPSRGAGEPVALVELLAVLNSGRALIDSTAGDGSYVGYSRELRQAIRKAERAAPTPPLAAVPEPVAEKLPSVLRRPFKCRSLGAS